MRSLSKMINALVLIMTLSACATAIPIIPEKYALDNQLEQVNEIRGFRLTGRPDLTLFITSFEDPLSVINRRDTALLNRTSNHWTPVDQQSLFVRVSPSEYYLLILQIPAHELMFSEDISIFCMGNVLKAGSDYVQFPDYNYDLRYTIGRIYKINGLEQMRLIKYQLRN